MYYVLAYDVSDTKRRGRIRKLLKGHGMRVQKSVFECAIEPDRLKKLVEKTSRFLDRRTDSLRIYSLCDGCFSRIRYYGCGEPPDDGGAIVA